MPNDIFGEDNEIKSLFTETEEEVAEQSTSLMVDEEEETEEVSTEVVETIATDDGDETIVDNTEATPFGKAAQALVKKGGFLVYEEDPEEGRDNYTEEEFVHLTSESINAQVNQLTENTIQHVLEGLSPTLQKVFLGELNGVKLKDIVADLADFQDLEELPEKPDDEQKERILKAYYKRQAKDRGKDGEWVTSKLEKIIERGDLDSEYDDAKDVISKDLENKIKEKEKIVQQEKAQKEQFKKYHSAFVKDVLKEKKIFDIPLSDEQVNKIDSVLGTFTRRKTDGKEKLGLAALVDNLIHSDNPKESYKILALMTMVGVMPNEMLAKLKTVQETQVTNDTVKKLKTAVKSPASVKQPVKKQTQQIGNVF